MFRSKVQLLAAGVSVLAINAVATGAQAQVNDPGLYQNDQQANGADPAGNGINIYTVPNGFFGGFDGTNDVAHAGTVRVTCGQTGATPAEGTTQAGCLPASQG